jgi:hypothetical protein
MALPASNIDPDIAAAYSGTSSPASTATQIDPDVAAAFKPSAPIANRDEPTIQDFEARHDVLGDDTSALYGQPLPWKGLGRSVIGAATNLVGMVPFAGEGMADAIRRHTQSIQPQNIGEQIGAAGIDASLPLLTAGMGAKPKAAETTADQVLANQASRSQTNMGAAAASPNVQNMSPGLQQAIVTAAKKTGGAVNPDVLERHVEADSLPVKVQLTEGQATQDPNILSNEVNSRGKNGDLANRYNAQNAQLGQNLQAIRDQVGSDVFSTNQVEHGDILIKAYQDKDAAVQTDINTKYKALRDANGATMPIDTGTLVFNVDAQLKKQYLTDSVPPQAQSILQSLRNGEPMDFENFEAARSRLAEAQREGGSGAKAAGIIRDNLEQMPLSAGASGLKDLADTARSAAKARFDAMDADPAYAAAVNGTVTPDRFTNRFVINGARDNVALMRQNLSDNPSAVQTMGVSALDYLKDQARIDSQGNGNFAAASFNKARQALDPKMQSLLDPKSAETLSTLGNVAGYVKGQPAGSFVNNSNTFTALAGEHAKNALEGAVNVAAKGVPVGTWIRKAAQGRAAAKATEQSLAPGAGLTKLSDVAKPP